MRIRTIKPTFWKSETMSSISKESRLLAIALLNYADDEGYFMANEALIRGECFPFDNDSKSIRRGLQELSKIGYIALGTTADGQKIGRVCTFLEHQRIDKASPSKIKEKTITWDDSTNTPRVLQESSPPEVEVGSGREVEVGSAAPSAALHLPSLGSEVPITEPMIAEWRTAFPAVDVMQELRAMRVWCLANPAKRKTPKGVPRFVVSWLSKQQNRGGSSAAPPRDQFAGAI